MDAAMGLGCRAPHSRAPSPTLGGSRSNRTAGRQGKEETFLGFRKSLPVFTSPSWSGEGPHRPITLSPWSQGTKDEVCME